MVVIDNVNNDQDISNMSAIGLKADRTFHWDGTSVRREMSSPFRYCGGKSYALRQLLPFLTSVPHDEYREPFLGGGSLFFAKKKAKHNWLNDLESNLMTTYSVIADSQLRPKLIKMLSKEVATRERHQEIKLVKASSPLKIAFKTYYLNRTSFSGIIHVPAWGYADGKSAPPSQWLKKIETAAPKLQGVELTNLDFEEVVLAPSVGSRTLLYVDPPYYLADQKRAYSKSFKEPDHVRVAKVLKKTRHLFCLSYDDCEQVRELYSWANIYEATWTYAAANCQDKARKAGRELVITNYKIVKAKQLGLFN